MRRAALSLGAALALAGCAALPSLDDVVPSPPPDPEAVRAEAEALSRALAGAVSVCLDAREAGLDLSGHVAAAGDPRRLGVRPAPAPLRGWVVRSGRANLYEEAGRCYAEPVGAVPPGTVGALRAALTSRADHPLAETEPPRAVEGTLSRWYTDETGVRVVLIAPEGGDESGDEGAGSLVLIVTGRV